MGHSISSPMRYLSRRIKTCSAGKISLHVCIFKYFPRERWAPEFGLTCPKCLIVVERYRATVEIHASYLLAEHFLWIKIRIIKLREGEYVFWDYFLPRIFFSNYVSIPNSSRMFCFFFTISANYKLKIAKCIANITKSNKKHSNLSGLRHMQNRTIINRRTLLFLNFSLICISEVCYKLHSMKKLVN